MPTFNPLCASETASNDETKDLPTPPFPETTPIIFFIWEYSFNFAKKFWLCPEQCSLQLLQSPLQEALEAQFAPQLLQSPLQLLWPTQFSSQLLQSPVQLCFLFSFSTSGYMQALSIAEQGHTVA